MATSTRRKANKREKSKVQIIWSEPRRILVGTKTSKNGHIRNVYKINKNAKHVKTIFHPIPQ